MKTYYKDDRVWITGGFDRFLFSEILPLESVYRRTLPNLFKMVKDRESESSHSTFVNFLKKHNINLVRRGPDFYEFAGKRDQFLFDLRFGAYDAIKIDK